MNGIPRRIALILMLILFSCASLMAAQRDIISSADDVYASVQATAGVSVNLTTGQVTYSGSASAESVTVVKNGTDYVLDSSLKEELAVTLKGTLNGTFTVNSTQAGYAIILDGATVTAADGPALNLLSKKRAFLVCTTGTTNVLTDSAVRSANTKKGAVYAKGALVLASPAGSASGSLTVNAGYKHGVYSDDYIRVTGCALTVNNTARDCIRCVNGFIMDSGNITLNGTGSNTDEESKGIKVDGEESDKHPGEGFIVINGGSIRSTTTSKGITAGWKLAEDAETETTADDPDPYLTINGGSISITTTGRVYEYTTSDGTTVNNSPEGLEAKSVLTINGGIIYVRTPDDCINAGGQIIINGGIIDVVSTENDAIDSNGTLTFNGGTISAAGATGPECAFDCDFNTFAVNGGTVFGTGGTNLSTPASSSRQKSIIWYASGSVGDTATVKDSSGKVIISQELKGKMEAAVLSSSEIKAGETYTLTVGSSEETVTVSGTVTTAGTSSGMFGRGGFGGFGGQFGGRDGTKAERMELPEGFDPSQGMPEGFDPTQGMPEGMEPPAGFDPSQGRPDGMGEPPEGFGGGFGGQFGGKNGGGKR